MSTKYTYSIITDTLNKKVDSSSLVSSITSSTITIALDYIVTSGDILNIYFKSDLSTSEQTILTGIVNAHTGVQTIPASVVTLDGPQDVDGRAILHSTPRPAGTFTYYTSVGDDQSDQTLVGYDSVSGGANIDNSMMFYLPAGITNQSKWIDFNCITNETNLSQGSIQWKGGLNDEILLELVPKLTTISAGTNTYFNLYGGYLVVPAAGDGTIAINTEDIKLVEMVPNEEGVTPLGFWNADFNTTTKQFENITMSVDAYGSPTGKYMIFANVGVDIVLYRFGNRIKVLGDGHMILPSYDSQRIGHGVRFKIACYTNVDMPVHDWYINVALIMHRGKTC